jgi:opacity protein-like surface antigen
MAWRSIPASFIVLCLGSAPAAHAQCGTAANEPRLGPGPSDPSAMAATRLRGPEPREPRSNTDRGGWAIAAYLGAAHTLASAVTLSQPALATNLTFDQVRFDSRSFEPPLYYGARGGYFLPGRLSLGIETEFVHLKVFSETEQDVRAAGVHLGDAIDREVRLSEIVQQYSISHGMNLLLVNIAVRRAMGLAADRRNRRLDLTGRLGVGPTLPHTESTIDGRHQEQYEAGRLGWQVGGGAELELWHEVYLLCEYKFTRTNQRGKVDSGTADALLRTHHVVFGVSHHF